MNFNIYSFLVLSVITNTLCDEIPLHIWKCCQNGVTIAREHKSCAEYGRGIHLISPLWRSLCLSTSNVCCSFQINKQDCEAGRLAAMTEYHCNIKKKSTFFSDCCNSCRIGLAVKASKSYCNDTLFSYFNKIDSFQICCNNLISIQDGNNKEHINNLGQSLHTIDQYISHSLSENISVGTIVLKENDDDICSKVPNLCQQICENTKEAYLCKCHSGFHLDANNVTCSLTSNVTHNIKKNKHELAVNVMEDIFYGTELKDKNVSYSDVIGNNCTRGYQYDIVQKKCIDIDECIRKTNNCANNQYCHNTIGGFHCLNIKDENCQGDEQLDTRNTNCTERNSWNTPEDDSTIECDEGFQLQNYHCVDKNECLSEENSCGIHQVCINEIGSYHCICKIGFNLDPATYKCIDINECSINNHNCLGTQRCDNTVGSYICTRLQSCGTGYTLNAETGVCDDDDECTLNTHNCPSDYQCFNTKGSFRCYRHHRPTTTIARTTISSIENDHSLETTSNVYYINNSDYPSYQYTSQRNLNYNNIPDYIQKLIVYSNESLLCTTGFMRNYLGACVDIDECSISIPCGSHQRCVNTNGSFRCQNLLQCATGYKSKPDGTSCVDVDECESGEHNCVENQICRNRNGGYICSCPPGHQLQQFLSGVSKCVDVNECEDGHHPVVCPANSLCINTIGSYYCECKSGFQKSSDNDRICLDIDECQEIPDLCQQKCINYWGGYRCSCNQGYELNIDNRTCLDVDECETKTNYKLCMGFCNNIPGSYECSCPRGYILAQDKSSCRDIDECIQDEPCIGRNDICTNIRGGYKCTTIHCPYGYVHDPDQKNRCRLASNICENEECFNKASAYTYNFITLVAKRVIPPEGQIIFNLRGPLWYNDVDFELKIIKIQAASNIEKATENHFNTFKQKNEIHLSLAMSLEGPQEIELEISMTVFTNGLPRGKSIAKVFIIVSEYTF